jgi:membrane protein DedA with SNARE-associated domain
MNFTVIDYAAFALWIPISIMIAFIYQKVANDKKKNRIILAIGLVLGHLLYLVWKNIFLYTLSSF